MITDPQPKLRIHLLGDFGVSIDGEPIRSLDKPRQQLLLAYLALYPGKPQPRAHVAFIFWPDSEEKQALANLRNLLHGLRRSLPIIEPFLKIDNRSIYLQSSPSCSIDLDDLKHALKQADLATQGSEDSAARKHLETAVKIYQVELLPKIYDNWIEEERESLRIKMDKALSQLIEILIRTGDFDESIRYSNKRIQFDRLNESNQYKHLELLELSGDRTAALLAYKTYQENLRSELSIEPGSKIHGLYQRIHEKEFSRSYEAPPAPAIDTLPETGERKQVLLRKVVLASVAAAAIFIALFFVTRNSETAEPSLQKSIAVLPFENKSHRDEDIFFTDGMHGDLINLISRIHDVKLISRTSVMGYRESSKDLKKIGKELGVTTIIEGGVQRSGDQIRVNVQLVDTSTGFHIWSNNYNVEFTADNIFSLQNSITESIARELKAVFDPSKSGKSAGKPTQNTAALEAYFRGKTSISDGSSDGLSEGIEYLKRTIDLDPNFAIAHTLLAVTYIEQIYVSGHSTKEQVAAARIHTTRALELDDTLSEAYVALGKIQKHEHHLESAEMSFAHAIELNPNNAHAYLAYAVTRQYQFGDLQTALELSTKAVELDPRNTHAQNFVAKVLMDLGRTEEARTILDEILLEKPLDIKTISSLGSLYEDNYNRYDEAIRYYRQAYALDPKNENLTSRLAWSYLKMGDKQGFLKWSERDIAIAPRSHKVSFLRGWTHEFRGETSESLANFEVLNKSDPNYDWSVYKLATAYVQEGRPQHALSLYEKSYPWIRDPQYEIHQKNFVQTIDYAYLHWRSGYYEKSQELAQRALEFLPHAVRLGSSGYQSFDAPLYIALGDIEGALATIKDYVESGGSSSLLATDVYTSEVHDEPEFQRLVAIVEARLAAQREHVQEMENSGELAPIPDLNSIIAH